MVVEDGAQQVGSVVVEPGQTLLDAGLAAGLPMPYSCTVGNCGAPAEERRTVARFNAAVARVVRREQAVLVDLSGDRALVGLTSADGFHPSTLGHQELARTFAAELPGT